LASSGTSKRLVKQLFWEFLIREVTRGQQRGPARQNRTGIKRGKPEDWIVQPEEPMDSMGRPMSTGERMDCSSIAAKMNVNGSRTLRAQQQANSTVVQMAANAEKPPEVAVSV
jgi:hypothetical protein